MVYRLENAKLLPSRTKHETTVSIAKITFVLYSIVHDTKYDKIVSKFYLRAKLPKIKPTANDEI